LLAVFVDGFLDGVGFGFLHSAHVGGCDLETVEHHAGPLRVDMIFTERHDEDGDGGGDGFVVFQGWEVDR